MIFRHSMSPPTHLFDLTTLPSNFSTESTYLKFNLHMIDKWCLFDEEENNIDAIGRKKLSV